MREIQDLAEPISYRTLRTRKHLVCSSTRVLTHHSTEQCAQDNLVCEQWMVSSERGVEQTEKLTEPSDEEPLAESFPFRSLDREIDRNAEERISKPVIGGGLGSNNPS